jgi:hypothetical protein
MYAFFGLIALSFIWPRLAAMSPVLASLNILDWLLIVPASTITRLLTGL